MFDDCVILGSSNASANGLALQGREVSGWHESNIITDDKDARDDASSWFRALPVRAISKDDLKAAGIAFSRRRTTHVEFWHSGTSIIDALTDHPERFKDKAIYVSAYDEELRVPTEDRPENRGFSAKASRLSWK